ncbi:hypothetical protein MK079_01310 [Candidatus Gracilibacteria bacterium]|nr:hypothetical protein [Candidatus Gracilibacteria bacterium]
MCKFIFFASISGVLFYMVFRFHHVLAPISCDWPLFIIAFILLQYAFFRFISDFVKHYNKLIVIHDDSIIILNASLILKDDIEILDARKIIKIDKMSRGIISNLMGFGNIIMEQQNNDVRTFHYVPRINKFVDACNRQREHIKFSRMQTRIPIDGKEA